MSVLTNLPLRVRMTGAGLLTCGALTASVFGSTQTAAAASSRLATVTPAAVSTVSSGQLSAVALAAPASGVAEPSGMYPVIAEAMSECDLIDLGVQGTCVYTVQKTMNETLNAGLMVDSQYGPATKEVVRRYQLSKGLVADGVVGEATKHEIRLDMQAAVDELDSGAVEPGLGGDSWVVDALCGLTGPLVIGCMILTH